jgi:hypothetical protein
MKQQIYLSIYEENFDGRVSKIDVEVDSLQSAVRYILTYKSKKGKKVVHVGIDIMEVLV